MRARHTTRSGAGPVGTLLVVLALVLAGCGGGGDDTPKLSERAKSAPAIGEGTPVKVQASLLGDEGETASAGDAESYEPSGEIIADSGFRPEVDGFSFENYGNDVGPENLTTAEVQSLFGDQVCIGGDGEDCRLIPPAKRWMDNQNEAMGGGHCMGFSVAAIRMFQEVLDPEDFGDDTTSELEIVDNVDLQKSIAEHWVYQALPLIQEKTVEGTPDKIVDRLVDTLNSGEEDYTIGIFMADGSGGHAVTPFAIEDKGDGKAAILVYDNNYPGITRAMDVDLEENSWQYVGGTNPQNLGEVYQGNADTKSMVLLPTTPGEEQQPCPFCRGEAAEDGEDLGSTLPDAKQYSEITLNGDVANHPHLILTDDQDRQTGIVDGKLKREIPGVEMDQSFSVRNWEAGPEPRYRVPAGKDIGITVDGSNLKKTATVSLDLVGGGLVVAVDEIRIAPGQQDNVYLDGKGRGFYYETNSKKDATPEFYAGLEDGDAAYTFAATAVGLKPGSPIGLLVDRESGTVLLDADGTHGSLDGKGYFGLLVGKETATRSYIWGTDELELDGKRGDGVYFNYKQTPKAGKSLELEVGPEDGPFKTVKAPYQP
ncbi:hypothetical protein [Paraconexibacter sp.]|uniref:hypothetical protein n=1 Tax=Paraconexibacter sp. TaxID=2949640 RepID=UPI003568B120